jgi:hypothetical protein
MNIEQRLSELEARVSRLEKEATEKEIAISLKLDGKEMAIETYKWIVKEIVKNNLKGLTIKKALEVLKELESDLIKECSV